MNEITLELLAILDAIDRRGSFAAAAEELDKVPSALSYTVQKYEDRLGLRIFERQGRRSVFTRAGRHLLERGRELTQAASRLADEVQTLASGWEPRISVAIDSLMPMAQVMAVLAGFTHRHPEVELDISEEVLGGAWEALASDRAQLAVGAPAPKPAGIGVQTAPLGVLQRVFAVSAGHPLAALERPLTEADVAPHLTVVVHDSSRTAVPRSTRLLNPDRRFYVQSIAQKLAAQLAGVGVGFLPRRLVEPYLASGEMVALAVEGVGLEDHLYLAWQAANPGRGLRELVKCFREADMSL